MCSPNARSLDALIGVLEKGKEWAKENNVDVDSLVEVSILEPKVDFW